MEQRGRRLTGNMVFPPAESPLPRFEMALEEPQDEDKDDIAVSTRNFLNPVDNRTSYLTIDSLSRSNSRTHSRSRRLSRSSHRSRSTSGHSRQSGRYSTDIEDMSFMENLAGNGDLTELKQDIRNAIYGAGDSRAGSWLASIHSKSPNGSKLSLPMSGDIELETIPSRAPGAASTSELESPLEESSPHLTIESMFQSISSRLRNTEGGRFGYKRNGLQRDTEDGESRDPSAASGDEKPFSLYGKSLGIFPPCSPFRQGVVKYIHKIRIDRWMGQLIVIQTTLLAYLQWNPAKTNNNVMFGITWVQWLLFAINILYTLDILAKCIAWGMWDDSQMFTHLNLEYNSLRQILSLHRVRDFFLTKETDYTPDLKKDAQVQRPSILTRHRNKDLALPIPRAFLRGSWNRVDFVSTVCFWINFILTVSGADIKHHISIFKALDSLRILRLTTLTERIGLIMTSIKLGAPQITDVLLFFAYFWTLFAIIGVQSFKSSLRRYCVWTNPNDPTETFETSQHCGGSLYLKNDGSLGRKPYLLVTGESGPRSKGFLCPVNSECMERENDYGNTFSYDTILNSLQMTFVVMSANTFTDIMYDSMDSESLAASIYFIFGLFVLYLWMANLLIAVINSSLTVAREKDERLRRDENNTSEDFDLNFHFEQNWVSSFYKKTKIIFDILGLIGMGVTGSLNAQMGVSDMKEIFMVQAIISWIFLVEIIWRAACYYPNWKNFFKYRRNILDAILVFVTCLMAIHPLAIKMGRLYYWLTIFQLSRFYRMVLLIGFVRKLWAKVWRSINLILNLSLFYFLLLFVCSIFFARYFEGYASPGDGIMFPLHTLPNVFLALFVITSTENWSEIMYDMEAVAPTRIATFILVALTFIWFLLSNTIVFNLFIAIIGDSLSASEAVKRKEQVKKFVLIDFPRRLKTIAERSVLSDIRTRVFRAENPFDTNLEVEKLLLNGAAVEEFLKDELSDDDIVTADDMEFHQKTNMKLLRYLEDRYVKLMKYDLLGTILRNVFWDTPDHRNPFFSDYRKNIGLDSYKSLHLNYQTESQRDDEEKRKFLDENPNYNRSLFFLLPEHPLRRLCQYVVRPSVGKRYDGVEPNKYSNFAFSALVVTGTVLLVIFTCINTPLYSKIHLHNTWNWTFEIEVSFAILFFLELFIKVIADGFLFTPNAYLLSAWNWIDLIVLDSLWIDILATLRKDEGLARTVSGLKALRALRFLVISETSRDIFQKVIIAGFGKIISASVLSITLIIPFAIWGVALFSTRLASCNDGGGYAGCLTEYSTEVFDWNILAPKVYSNPILHMDDFGSSLLTLFEILSLEGWVDLLKNLVDSTGVGTPMEYFASPGNAVFVVLFIFIGIVFSLTLFISVIINNYARLSGSAFLTLQQTSWNEVKKLLSQATPRQRPTKANLNNFRSFCFKFGVERPNGVTAMLQFFLWIHILAILLEKYPSDQGLDTFRYTVYITSSTVLLIFNLMKLIAIGPKKFFLVRWNSYEFIVYFGAFATSLASFFVSRNTVFANINKLFLVGIFTMLIHMSNRLSHLLKIASASLPSMLSLMFTWAVLFLVFAIALNQFFGLTKVGPNTTGNMNFRTVPKALILLFRNSFGEAWNYTMCDFAIESPYCTNSGAFNTTDCGNEQYAYILFIAWNIISMYIFVNMFVSLIFENFSYFYSDNTGTIVLTREEIRHFKSVWSEFDPKGNGYVMFQQLGVFLQSLEGYFSFKVFDGKWTIPELTKSFMSPKHQTLDPYDVDVDIIGLNRMLRQLDVEKAKLRRSQHEKFIEECQFNMERHHEPGISFYRLIFMIPLYSKFDENNCLQLTEFLDRLVVSRNITERLQLKRQLEVLKMIAPRLRFLQSKGKLKRMKIPRIIRTSTSQNVSLDRFQDDYNVDSGFDFSSPFSPQVPQSRRSRLRPRTSFDQSLDESYWSPPPPSGRSVRLVDGVNDRARGAVMDELSGIAYDLKDSLWRDELKVVSKDLDLVMEKRRQKSALNSEDEDEDEKSDSSKSDIEDIEEQFGVANKSGGRMII